MMIRDIVGFVALVFLLQPKGINARCELIVHYDSIFGGQIEETTATQLVGTGIYYSNLGDFTDDAVGSAVLSSAGDEICCAHFYDLDTDSLSVPMESYCIDIDVTGIGRVLVNDVRTSKIFVQDSFFLVPDNKIVSDQIDDIHSDINENIGELDTEISNAVTTLGTCFCGNEIDNGKNEIINAIKNEMNTNDEILNTNDEILNTNDEILNTNDEILSILRMILSRKSDSSDNVLSAGSINEEFDSTHGNQQDQIVTITIDRGIFYSLIALGVILVIGMFIIVIQNSYKSNH
eukprot:508696_1